MIYSQTGEALTEQFEGVRLVAYQDSVGVWTIGYGHTRGVIASMTCTEAQAWAWLQDDLLQVEAQINNTITVTLTQGEFDALVDFGFNLGCHALETSTLWAKLQAGDFAGAAAEFPRWDHAGGKVIEGLLTRRLAEQKEFNS